MLFGTLNSAELSDNQIPKRALLFCRCLVVCIIIGWLWYPLQAITTGSDAYLIRLYDDSFYYIVIARHILHNGFISFDGITLTNGFQPLWLGVVGFVMFITGGAGPAFFATMFVLCGMIAYVTFELFLRLGKAMNMPGWITLFLSILVAPHFTNMIMRIMDTAAVIPLQLLLILTIVRLESIEHIPAKKIVFIGVLSSVLILARLETALFVALLLLGWWIINREKISKKLTTIALFCIAGAPLAAYLAWNLIEFGSIFPVSMLAKSLKDTHLFSNTFFRTLIINKSLSNWLCCITVPIALVFLFIRRKYYLGERYSITKRIQWYVLFSGIAFPVIFYILLSVNSDWVILAWYFYPVPLTLFFSLYIIFLLYPTGRIREHTNATTAQWAFIVVSIYAIFYIGHQIYIGETFYWTKGVCTPYDNARAIKTFSQNHPGIYAMGDCCGITSYIMNVPVLQLEGFAADANMVENIRRQRDLNAILRDYNVDYLIVSVWVNGGLPLTTDGCYIDTEPNHIAAGKHSLTMKGTICSPSILNMYYPDENGYTYLFPISSKAIAETSKDGILTPEKIQTKIK